MGDFHQTIIIPQESNFAGNPKMRSLLPLFTMTLLMMLMMGSSKADDCKDTDCKLCESGCPRCPRCSTCEQDCKINERCPHCKLCKNCVGTGCCVTKCKLKPVNWNGEGKKCT